MKPAQQEYRLALAKLWWAAPVANAAGILALLQLIGNVDQPDYALHSLRIPMTILAVGAVLGLLSILIGQLSLLSRWHEEVVTDYGTSETDGKKTLDPEFASDVYRAYQKGKRYEDTAFACSLLSVTALVIAGCVFIVMMSTGARIQPRPPSANVDRAMTAADILLGAIPSPAPATRSKNAADEKR